LNKQYLTLWDTQQTQTISVRVSYASYRAWLRVQSAKLAHTNEDTIGLNSMGYANGMIYVVPFTKLQTPLDTLSKSIIVSVHSDNIQFNGVCRDNVPFNRQVYTEGDSVLLQVPVTEFNINKSNMDTSMKNLEYFGEAVRSLRQLGRRYMTNRSLNFSNSTSTAAYFQQFVGSTRWSNNLPYGGTFTGLNNEYDIFTHCEYAFVGFRGGLKFRFRRTNINSIGQCAWLKVGFGAPALTDSVLTYSQFATTTTANISHIQGTHCFVPVTNSGIEVEFPFYTSNSFLFSFAASTQDVATDNMEGVYFRNWLMVQDDGPLTSVYAQQFSADMAMGEDFSFLRYQGSPFYSSAP